MACVHKEWTTRELNIRVKHSRKDKKSINTLIPWLLKMGFIVQNEV